MRPHVVMLGLAALMAIASSIVAFAGGWRGNSLGLGLVFGAEFAFLAAYAYLVPTRHRTVAAALLAASAAIAFTIAVSVSLYLALQGNYLQLALALGGLVLVALFRPLGVRVPLLAVGGILVIQVGVSLTFSILGVFPGEGFLWTLRVVSALEGLALAAAAVAEARLPTAGP